MFNEKVTGIWSKYEKIKDQHNSVRLNSKSETCHNFFNGKQWRGIAHVKEDELPFLNIIQPTVEYKVATVAQQEMTITFSPMSGLSEVEHQKICDVLNDFAKQQWELHKMDIKCWEVVKDSCIVGDSYIYFYDGDLNAQIIDNINVFLADEQEPDIQKQKFIIIYERRNVSDVKEEAAQNKIPKKDIDNIVPDDDTDNLTEEARKEVDSKTDGKCSCLLMLTKDKDGVVTVTRSTKTVEYQPKTRIFSQNKDEANPRSVALKIYPIANFIWQKKKGSARGLGEVEQLIPNQVSINKNLARREQAIQQCAFPKLVYNSNYITNADNLDVAGAQIEISKNAPFKVNEIIDYLNPRQLSSDAKQFGDELVQVTRDLVGSGDSALGNIDPTKASGTAIIAVQDQSAIPLNEQKATFKQFVEDIALIWYYMWIAYNPQGIEVPITEVDPLSQEEYETIATIPTEILQEMKVNIKIDVAPNNPFSKYAQQQALDNLFSQKHITLEEYVELLDDNSSVPKGRLKAILEKRIPEQPQLPQQPMIPQGGMPIEMQQM